MEILRNNSGFSIALGNTPEYIDSGVRREGKKGWCPVVFNVCCIVVGIVMLIRAIRDENRRIAMMPKRVPTFVIVGM